MRRTRDFDDLVVNNNDVVLKNIAEDLQNHIPREATFNSEHLALQKINQHPLPMIHVDAFLYDDDFVDSLCEEGKMSRSYCIECGSYKAASLASQLYGVEMNADFCQLQEMTITEYQFIDIIKMGDLFLPQVAVLQIPMRMNHRSLTFAVVHADICIQASLLQKADVVVMNNVFEYFLERQEQARRIIQLSQCVEEMQLNYDVHMEKEVGREAVKQIHLYKIL